MAFAYAVFAQFLSLEVAALLEKKSNVFVLKRCSSVSQDWPCFEGQTRIGEVGCGSRQIEGQAWPD